MNPNKLTENVIHKPLTEDSFAKPKTLSREKSIDLWLKGKNTWNLWMENHPNTSVDFSFVVFTLEGIVEAAPNVDLTFYPELHRHLETISFEGYIFNGQVVFSGATFPTPTFFDEARFEENANFTCATFANPTSFNKSIFNSTVSFNYVVFQNAVIFDETHFAESTSFASATFEHLAYFPSTTFNELLDFTNAEFNRGTDFQGAEFFCEDVLFDNIHSTDTFNFNDAQTQHIEKLSFKGGSFDRDFIIGGKFNCIPDLRGTKLNHHTELSDLEWNLRRHRVIPFTPIFKVSYPDDAVKLCRLKELAEQNKNHDKALSFNADEMRAKRWVRLNTWQSMLDLLYSATSNYGQSILRPSLWLLLSFMLFSSYLVNKSELGMKQALPHAATTSIATLTPFISVSKDARQFGMGQLFEADIPNNYYLWSYAHASASFVFIFLIGLGLRNRFRV